MRNLISNISTFLMGKTYIPKQLANVMQNGIKNSDKIQQPQNSNHSLISSSQNVGYFQKGSRATMAFAKSRL